MFIKAIKIAALLSIGSLTLTACDPPMPPEVLATLAEQSYTCEAGDTQITGPLEILTAATDWQATVESNCPGMTITPVEASTPEVELQVGNALAAGTKAYVTVPFAVDAVVIAVTLTDITNVNLNADAIEKIWSGQITKWNDSVIVALNPNFTLPATSITFGSELDAAMAQPLADWVGRLAGHDVNLSAGAAKLDDLVDGSLVITTYSRATTQAVPVVGIVTSKTPGVDGIIPDNNSINSGATMFKSKITSGIVQLTYDPAAKPVPPEGVDVAPVPYQAVSVINLNLVGTDSLKTRAAARYVLRQDSQGSLGLTTLIALPETLRIIALTEVSKGLPEPVITPSAN